MAWRIDEHVVRGEIDNRNKGQLTGTLWLHGREKPVILDLNGNPWRDLAGVRIRFNNPDPQPGLPDGFADVQTGVVGDITASRKVRMPDCSMKEFIAGYKTGKTFTFHMANSLYLEWFSERNGRIVIESAAYQLEIDSEPTWQMTEQEEIAQRTANQQAITGFMDRLVEAIDLSKVQIEDWSDAPTSDIEAKADAETVRMDRLLDRVTARFENEGLENAETFDRIWEEERENMRIELGEPEPVPLTPEELAEQSAWIEEVNREAREAIEKGEDLDMDDERHPLVETCFELGMRLYHEIKDKEWLSDNDPAEHPLREIETDVQAAGAKLAGALHGTRHSGEWPPDPLFAGDTLVRLKKARTYLRNALNALDVADEQRLAEPGWRSQTRIDITAVFNHVEQAIHEVRSSLE